MIYKGSFHAHKVLIQWKDWFPNDGSRIFAANVDHIKVILPRKMINRGSVRDAKVLIKWKALPLKHDTCDYSSLRQGCWKGRIF